MRFSSTKIESMNSLRTKQKHEIHQSGDDDDDDDDWCEKVELTFLVSRDIVRDKRQLTLESMRWNR